MNTFEAPLLGNLYSDVTRREWRVAIHDAIQAWENAGRPRDAVEVVTIERVQRTIETMRAVTDDTDERANITELAVEVEKVVAHLSDADANRVTPTLDQSLDAIAESMEADPHADCRQRADEMRANLRDALAPITDPADHRLEPIWEKAHEVADSRGYCETFDELCEELGAPSRMVDVTFTVTGTFSTSVRASDLSNDWRDAGGEAIDCCSIDWEVSSYERD